MITGRLRPGPVWTITEDTRPSIIWQKASATMWQEALRKKETHMGFWISNETLDLVRVKAKIAVKTLDFQMIEEQEVFKESNLHSVRKCLFEKEYKELIAGRDDSVFFVVEI